MSEDNSHESGGLLKGLYNKLTDRKKDWAREGRGLTDAPNDSGKRPDRLPPGQHLVTNWPVLDLGVQPDIPTDKWRLVIDGLVENPVTWNWNDFTGQPVFNDVSDMHCVTTWSRYDNQWEGVSAKHILSLVRPQTQARFVVFHSFDSYTTNIPLSAFDDNDVLLATKWDGAVISKDHGGPVRVILPKLYLWKSAKWVKRIEFIAEDRRGFWEERGYHNHGDPWKEERYSAQEE
ncbi:MAG: sulfite oxidase-like oxidoreductase [Rhodospirillaceae bacterium]|jgi:DMSO/TMAO reductase YedYZ molybdopterin-dependent catalytic subunit|nr:sulfite oxidase-like oxidoreductase [Rhodospirillaceae bacterium]MBT5373262.1 sulfite oxidase-like oxidoreductase [Rhodospirillaceae bacterium]MBT5660064.1 sulfite oxidase-like oxidoreductase [Rhodospirillaceae bacterium]MBT5752740.1 sulfite oxidase-like oxidoreductase [Rhodospirillaceae bacterium]